MKNVWGRFSLVLLLSSLFLSCTANYKPVVPGLNVLLGERLNLIYGKRVGIITNQTAITRNGTSIVDTLTAIPGEIGRAHV